MTYNVFGGTLSLTQSINQSAYLVVLSMSSLHGLPQMHVRSVGISSGDTGQVCLCSISGQNVEWHRISQLDILLTFIYECG